MAGQIHEHIVTAFVRTSSKVGEMLEKYLEVIWGYGVATIPYSESILEQPFCIDYPPFY